MKPKAIERAEKKMERAQLAWRKSVEYFTSRDYKNIADFNRANRMVGTKHNKYREAMEELRELCEVYEKAIEGCKDKRGN